MNDDAFFYQTCGGVAVGAGLPHFQSAAKAPQAFGAKPLSLTPQHTAHYRRLSASHVASRSYSHKRSWPHQQVAYLCRVSRVP